MPMLSSTGTYTQTDFETGSPSVAQGNSKFMILLSLCLLSARITVYATPACIQSWFISIPAPSSPLPHLCLGTKSNSC